MKLLVVGGSGFIGTSLLRLLQQEKCTVISLGRNRVSYFKKNSVNHNEVKTDFNFLEEIFLREKPERAINLSANFSNALVPEYVEQAITGNFLIGSYLGLLCAKYECSLTQIFSEWQLMSPNARPKTEYLASKTALETFLKNLTPALGVLNEVYVGDTFGALDNREKLVNLAARALAKGDDFAPRNPERKINLSHVDDVSRLIYLVSCRNRSSRSWICSTNLLTVEDVINVLYARDFSREKTDNRGNLTSWLGVTLDEHLEILHSGDTVTHLIEFRRQLLDGSVR